VTQGEVDRALAEQRRTGELFGESLLRSFQGKAESIPASMGLGHAQLQRVELDSVDVLAVYLLGYATCALYCVVPLTSGAEHTKTLASPFALSASLVERAEKRLGCHVEVVCAPALHVRAGLAHALTQARLAVGDHGFSELGGMDAEELRVIREERVSALSDSEIKRATRAAAISPIDLLVRRGELNPQTAAQLRARALGVEWVPAAAPADKTALSEPPGNTAPRVSMLPPSFLEAHDIRVVSEDGACVCLAAPRPTPALTRMAGRWLPERVIEWRVAA
jgi:hypothetical protein